MIFISCCKDIPEANFPGGGRVPDGGGKSGRHFGLLTNTE